MVEPPSMEMEVTKNQLKKMYFDMTCIRCVLPTLSQAQAKPPPDD